MGRAKRVSEWQRAREARKLSPASERLSVFSTAAEIARTSEEEEKKAADHVFLELKPEYWGISKPQIIEFGQLLRKSIDAKDFLNASQEECKAQGIPYYEQKTFDELGPNMYAVNHKFIKPETATGDKQFGIKFLSYAVMVNTAVAGLWCDLFLSHAWSEPIFEFLASMGKAWPEKCQAAYFCCLSNPQHLDISGMISNPLTSPFYRVLDGCRPRVIMVANSEVAIHTRLWCVYEAFK